MAVNFGLLIMLLPLSCKNLVIFSENLVPENLVPENKSYVLSLHYNRVIS